MALHLHPKWQPPLILPHRCRPCCVSLRPSDLRARSFRRSDLDSFARRVASGDVLRDAWFRANDGAARLFFELRRSAERLDRRFSFSRHLDSLARSATDRARRYGLACRCRAIAQDFFRNLPRYRRVLNGLLQTPLGSFFSTIFFLWFALSGWMFRFFILATWILPFAAPLLIGTVVKNFVIEGVCPACKRRFIGYKSQIILCTGCRNIVWQPGNNFSGDRGGRTHKASYPDIIDIEIEEK